MIALISGQLRSKGQINNEINALYGVASLSMTELISHRDNYDIPAGEWCGARNWLSRRQ